MYNSKAYTEDLSYQIKRINLETLKNKKILITGATGLICSYLIDLLIYANKEYQANIDIYALSRSDKKLRERFSVYYNEKYFKPVIQDVCSKIDLKEIDYIIHGASPATPNLYMEQPVDTMNANYLGMLNILEYARQNNCKKVIYISSSEVYGTADTNTDLLEENNYGYVNLLEVRSSYASSKRATETLCIAYQKQYGCNVSIVRPAHIYGPTMTKNDSRAVSSFLRNVTSNQDIVMKSDGSSVRSYCYVGDTAIGILTVLLKGNIGEAYNLSNTKDIISIKELATKIATISGKKLIIDIPTDNLNKKINSNPKEIKISSKKLEELGWNCEISIEEGIKKSIEIINALK